MTSEPSPQKITQLQCAQTNNYLKSQFLQWLTQSFKYQPQILARFHNQLELLLGIAQYKVTVGIDKPQPGDFLQNIRYTTLSKTQKIMYLVFTAILPYIVNKLSAYAAEKDGQLWRKIQRFIAVVQKIIVVLQFLNYGVFIFKGEYRSLAQRILRMNMAFVDSKNKRVLNFALMNRTMVWRVYELFLKTVLPYVFSFCAGPLKNLFYMSSYLQPDTSSDRSCVFCAAANPVMPRVAACGHIACYYCSQSNATQQCPLCSSSIQTWKPSVK